MNRSRLILLLGLGMHAAVVLAGDNWPEFRGPQGNGQTDAKGLPLTWAEDKNVTWKTPIHGRAWSSPVVWGKQVWVTTATEDGRELAVLCLDRETGQIERDLKLFEVEKPQFAHKFNTYASPTPVIEEGRIYVTFGSPGTACLDTKTGKVLWERRDFVCNHFRGAGSSPILHGNLLIMNFDGSDHQFVAALDKKTGKTVWQVNRSLDYKDLTPEGKPEADGDWRKAYATPHVATIHGVTTLLSSGAKAHYGYDPLTGKELWRVDERTSHSAGTRPVVGHGMVFIPTGWSAGFILAIKPGKTPGQAIDAADYPKADLPVDQYLPADRLQVVWKTKRSSPRKPSLLLIGDLLFANDDAGLAMCLDAKTGKEIWRERIGGNYSASPIFGEGRLYFFSEEGKAVVLEASRQFKVLAENTLADGFMASPAAAGKALFLRTKSALYRVEQK